MDDDDKRISEIIEDILNGSITDIFLYYDYDEINEDYSVIYKRLLEHQDNKYALFTIGSMCEHSLGRDSADMTEAIGFYERSHKLGCCIASQALGMLYIKCGKPEKALRTYGEALRLNPKYNDQQSIKGSLAEFAISESCTRLCDKIQKYQLNK